MKLSSKVLLTVLLTPSVFGGITNKSKPTQSFHKIGKRLNVLQNRYRVRNVEENVDDYCFDGNNTDSNDNNDSGSNDSGSDDNSDVNSLSPSTSPTTRLEDISNAMYNIYTALGTTTVDLTAATYCSWNGVTCDSDNIEPISIFLPHKGLTGYLATDIGMITELMELELVDNDLTGTLPAELSKNTLLIVLSIDDNLISGPIPEALNELTSLIFLGLSTNMLTGTLPDLSGLSVDYLFVDNKMLTGTISSLELPSDPKVLSLYSNEFTSSIPDVSGFSALSYLILSDNAFSSTIPDASQFPSTLGFLFLGRNDLTGTLPDLSSLPLIYFECSYTMLDEQPLPSWQFGVGSGLDPLLGFYAAGTQFTGTIPKNLYTISMEMMIFNDNQLTGSINTAIGVMTNLKYINIADNDFTQTFDSDWNDYFNLLTAIEQVNFDNNNFDGTITAFCDDGIDFNYEDTSISHVCGPV